MTREGSRYTAQTIQGSRPIAVLVGVHSRDKGMLEVQDNNQANVDVQCRGARQC